MDRKVITLDVNDSRRDAAVRPYDLLLDVIREDLNLTGTKRGCDMGTCGCCTVQIDGQPRLSCLTLALEAEGKEITTIEGLPEKDGTLHPLQECWAEAGASQCGFCSPGFLMCASKLLRDTPRPTRAQIEEAVSGNVCRCTGFVKIVEAIEKASKAVVDKLVTGNYLAKINTAAGSATAEGRIIKVDGQRAWINLGGAAGLKVGDTFDIYAIGEELIDPDTGAKLGADEKQTGSGQVTEIQEKFAIITFTGTAKAKDTIRKK